LASVVTPTIPATRHDARAWDGNPARNVGPAVTAKRDHRPCVIPTHSPAACTSADDSPGIDDPRMCHNSGDVDHPCRWQQTPRLRHMGRM